MCFCNFIETKALTVVNCSIVTSQGPIPLQNRLDAIAIMLQYIADPGKGCDMLLDTFILLNDRPFPM